MKLSVHTETKVFPGFTNDRFEPWHLQLEFYSCFEKSGKTGDSNIKKTKQPFKPCFYFYFCPLKYKTSIWWDSLDNCDNVDKNVWADVQR